MSNITETMDESLKTNIDIIVNNFFVKGTRNYIRKTTLDAPWLNVGIMEKTNPSLFHTSKLFAGMNVICGGMYSLGHDMIRGDKDPGTTRPYVEQAVAALNALPADEIIFYHDENLCGLEQARKKGLAIKFKPVSLLEWLVRRVKEEPVSPLDVAAAVQLPCSARYGGDRNELLNTLFSLIGVTRVQRRYDQGEDLCCGAPGYFGFYSGDIHADADYSDELVLKNVADAKAAGAEYMVTMCPNCYAAIAPVAREAGMTPVQVEGLVSLALFGKESPVGIVFN